MTLRRFPVIAAIVFASVAVSVADTARLPEAEGSKSWVAPLWSAQLTTPTKVSGSLGVIRSFRKRGFIEDRHGLVGTGVLLQLEAGLAGGKLALGYAEHHSLGGYAVKLVGLRTWGDPWFTEPDQTYVGPEAQYSFALFKVGGGILYRVGDGPGDQWLITAGVGFGF
jgi:hypothetical protein